MNEQEEYRRTIELEAEERKLEETLEYQRRMENEAKLQHLAEQTKRTAKTCPGSINAVMKFDTCSKNSDNGQVIDEQLKSSKKVNTLMLGFSYFYESFPILFYILYKESH